MSAPKIKHKKLPTVKRTRQLTLQHLNDTSLLTDFIRPSWRPEEEAEARYLASSIANQFTARATEVTAQGQKTADESAARRRHLTIVLLYRMLVQGTLKFYDILLAPAPSAPSAADSSESEEMIQKIMQAPEESVERRPDDIN